MANAEKARRDSVNQGAGHPAQRHSPAAEMAGGNAADRRGGVGLATFDRKFVQAAGHKRVREAQVRR